MRKIKLIIAAMLVFGPMVANAVPIVQTATCTDTANQCATGIIGLEVMDMVFDVSFITGSAYNAVYAADDPFFLGDAAGAEAALDAIIAAFADVIFGVVGEGSDANFASRFFIPSSTDGALNSGSFGFSSAGSTIWNPSSYSTGNSTPFDQFEPEVFSAYVVFEKVPEPATLTLLGISLFGMGLARRKA